MCCRSVTVGQLVSGAVTFPLLTQPGARQGTDRIGMGWSGHCSNPGMAKVGDKQKTGWEGGRGRETEARKLTLLRGTVRGSTLGKEPR